MKLTTKFVIIYLIITVIVLSVGGVISYFVIRGELNNELKYRFMDRINRVTHLLDRGRRFNKERIANSGGENMEIRKLSDHVESRVEVRDTMVWHERLQQMEPNLKVEAYRTVDGESYYISTYGALIESDDVKESVIQMLLWILGLQVIGAIGVGFVVSSRLFKPFRETLKRIQSFKLQEKKPIEAEKTDVKEFDDLNRFVREMTQKAVSDYVNLKEFAENASHELKTPLAIAKGKLELLTETDLNPEQYNYVEATQRTIKKLSRLSESLGLLTKIENHEFNEVEQVNLTELIQESLKTHEELISLNKLTIKSDLGEDVYIAMHPVLADIMWANLFQNAIKHNVENGNIKIILKSDELVISNTGEPLNIDPEILFQRFKKDDQSSDSIGLGLSIIKRISEQYDFDIKYRYEEGWHSISIKF